MSIYFRYEPDGTSTVVLSYVDDCVHWFTSEALGKWFMDTLWNRFHVNFLGYAHWFISIIIYQMKYHSIYVYQARYDTSVVAKYLFIVTVNASTRFYKTKLPSDMIFTKADASNSDEQVKNLTRKFSIQYRACSVSLIRLFSTRVDL